ncbi:MAG: GGDEF domain-containing phosphodiesterase [Pseudomonadota bacterium]|nr:GGDEF domain-containing phosphodiesterase [Pseudomonadota bacterium]
MSSLPPADPALVSDAVEPDARAEMLKFLDRETAVARATDGRLAVLILELRRVDRLQALLRGPAPATTMGLVVDRLRKALRPEDRVAALSDEQVCVVLPRLAHPSQAVLAAVKLLRALDRPMAHEGGSAVLRPCVGVATLPEHGFDPAELLMAADVARHIAATREEGYHVMQAEDQVDTEVYRGLDLDLERAIRANELELHYQPQVELAGGRAVGVEALVRWRHLKAGEVSAPTIVGVAERTGLISSLTHWILNAALRQAAQWRAADIAPRISMNLSLATLTDRELPSVVDQSIKTWGVPAGGVVLEIAESSMIVDAERSVAILTRLKGVGVQLSIDDFGSGFSSLSHMRRFPIDEIKIDRPFVRAMLEERGDMALVRSAIDLGHHFGLRVVAEGVESQPTLAELARLGCDIAQGHAVSAALTPPAFRDWWLRHAAGS